MYMFTGQGRSYAAPSQTFTNAQQSPLPGLDVEVRPVDQPILGLLLGGLGCFFLNIFYNTVQPNLPSKALGPQVPLNENFHGLKSSRKGKCGGE
jgi:hypothetical protein